MLLNSDVMKKMLYPLLVAAAAAVAACSSMTGASVDPELAAAVKARLESGRYKVNFDRATANSAVLSSLPNASRLVNLTSDYNIRISGDSIHSYLPYFGEAYTAVIGRQNGLVFDEPITEYRISERRRGVTEIKFSARTFEDRYEYTLAVYSNGTSYLTVNPDRKTSISFDGKLDLEK